MTEHEFVDRAMSMPGLPWVKWGSDWAGADCFGLIVLWFREVRGIELGPVPHTDIAGGFAAAQGWAPCGPEPGATAWMAFSGPQPMHCGLLLDSEHVLHSQGSEDAGGSVRLTRISVMRRMFSEIRFYRFTGAMACS